MNTTAKTFVCLTRGFQLYQGEGEYPDIELYLNGYKDGVEAEGRMGDQELPARVLDKTQLHSLILELFHDAELAKALDSHFARLNQGSAQVVANSLIRLHRVVLRDC